MAKVSTRRIMRDFVIKEISAVDRPAQQGAVATIMKRDVSDDERERLAEEGNALPDGSYPIKTKSDLSNAIQAFGRAKNKAQVKRHIVRRARELGALDMLPESWEVSKAVEAIVKAYYGGPANPDAQGARSFEDVLGEQLASDRYYEVMREAGAAISALDCSLRSIAADANMSSSSKQDAMRSSTEQFLSTIRERWPDIEEALEEGYDKVDDGLGDLSNQIALIEMRTDLLKIAARIDAVVKFNPSQPRDREGKWTEGGSGGGGESSASEGSSGGGGRKTTNGKIGHLTGQPNVEIAIETKGKKRNVVMRSPGVKPVVLYRDLDPKWDDAKVADYLSSRDASKFKDAGGVTWL